MLPGRRTPSDTLHPRWPCLRAMSLPKIVWARLARYMLQVRQSKSWTVATSQGRRPGTTCLIGCTTLSWLAPW